MVVKHYRFIDFTTQFYIAAVGVLIAVFNGDRVDRWALVAASHALCLGVVHLLILAQAARPNIRWLAASRCRSP